MRWSCDAVAERDTFTSSASVAGVATDAIVAAVARFNSPAANASAVAGRSSRRRATDTSFAASAGTRPSSKPIRCLSERNPHPGPT